MEVSQVLLAQGTDVGLNTDYAAAILEWKKHAIAQYPEEACGFILEDGSFLAAENMHEEPTVSFKIDKHDFIAAGKVIGLLHSHTPQDQQDPAKGLVLRAHPTDIDMKTQMAMGIPWGISTCSEDSVSDPIWWGDSLPIRALVGRPFIWGINDCYSLVRDWHRVQGITIPDFPRSIGFWENDDGTPGISMYDEFFKDAGFVEMKRDDGQPLPGDCFICPILAKVRNHAGVYLGGGLILHHTMDRLSRRDPANMWQSKMDFLVRHKDLPDDAELVDA